jgi:hypothetical protein
MPAITPTSSWPLERVLFALAGSVTLISALLAALVSPWFLLLTAFVCINVLIAEQARVDQLGRPVWPHRRHGPNFICGEVGGHVVLAGEAQLMAGDIEGIGRLVQVEAVRG